MTINTTDVGTTQSADGITITADAVGATYQWIDCDNGGAPIAGETNQSFTATANGNYAVIVNQNDCVDTSSCVNVNTVGQVELVDTKSMKLYPNPTKGNLTIDLGSYQEVVRVNVFNLSGKIVYQQKFSNTNTINLLIKGEKGAYIVEVITEKSSVILRTIKY